MKLESLSGAGSQSSAMLHPTLLAPLLGQDCYTTVTIAFNIVLAILGLSFVIEIPEFTRHGEFWGAESNQVKFKN